jgi:hypothetical protein
MAKQMKKVNDINNLNMEGVHINNCLTIKV